MIQFLLIAVFMAMFLRDAAPGAWMRHAPAGLVAATVIAAMVAIWLAAHAYIWLAGRRLDRTGDFRLVRRADMAAAAARLIATIAHGVAVLGLGWLDVVRDAMGNLIIVDEFVAALPVLGVFVGTWWSVYPIDRRLREAVLIRDLDEGRAIRPMPSRWAAVLSALRHQAALVLVPVAGVLAWYESVERYAPRLGLPAWLPVVALEVLGMVVVLSLMPVVMRRVWDTVALEAGPLRETLGRMCREHRVRVRELLVWRTGGTMINGAVMGFAGPLRYVLLTDALLESLPAEQVEAVMAHELGHVRRRHMAWLGVAALSVLLMAEGAGHWALTSYWPQWQDAAWANGLVVLVGVSLGLVLFGLVSRRFEWQADAFAVQHLSGHRLGRRGAAPVVTGEAVAAMTGALEAVARLNSIPREKFTWRHGSIAARQRRLAGLVGRRADQLGVDREVRLVKVLAAAAMIAAIAVVATVGVS